MSRLVKTHAPFTLLRIMVDTLAYFHKPKAREVLLHSLNRTGTQDAGVNEICEALTAVEFGCASTGARALGTACEAFPELQILVQPLHDCPIPQPAGTLTMAIVVCRLSINNATASRATTQESYGAPINTVLSTAQQLLRILGAWVSRTRRALTVRLSFMEVECGGEMHRGSPPELSHQAGLEV